MVALDPFEVTDDWNIITRTILPVVSGNVTSNSYNAAGELSQTMTDTGPIVFGHDTMGRVTTITDRNGNPMLFSFYASGEIASMTDGDGTSPFVNDFLGRLYTPPGAFYLLDQAAAWSRGIRNDAVATTGNQAASM